jgi:lipopolysaccharide export LptBFGC system permease protein LptF
VAEERVKLHSRVAFPLVTLVMTILAVPFGVTIGRHGALYGMGLAMGLGFMHFLLAYFFMATGTAGVLPPALAAWAADLLFLAVALYLLLTVKT